jgi:hypothetical protein
MQSLLLSDLILQKLMGHRLDADVGLRVLWPQMEGTEFLATHNWIPMIEIPAVHIVCSCAPRTPCHVRIMQRDKNAHEVGSDLHSLLSCQMMACLVSLLKKVFLIDGYE